MFVPFDEAAASGGRSAAPVEGCAYIDGEPHEPRCGAPVQRGSPYCPQHHALCHVPKVSPKARRQIREIEALAQAVGGRQGRPERLPPDRFLRRLERQAQLFLRLDRSRIVHKEGGDAQE
jgi:hypothetical protein